MTLASFMNCYFIIRIPRTQLVENGLLYLLQRCNALKSVMPVRLGKQTCPVNSHILRAVFIHSCLNEHL